MLDLDRLFADCEAAVARDASHKSVCEIVARAVSDPDAVIAVLGEPRRSAAKLLYRSPSLTVVNLVWAPGMTVLPHDHGMWAAIGVYTGREDNIFWRRLPPDAPRGIEAAGARSLCRGDCMPLGSDIIHSVTNPLSRLTAAIHVYGGDLLSQERSQWDAETLREEPYDIEADRQQFEAPSKA
jgi:predicted metal-dependent enzyme (double-stranded beta helix superfamily)